MKILIISAYYPPHLGGIEIVASNHAVRLAARGHDVSVLTTKVATNEVSGVVEGVNVERIKAIDFFNKKLNIPFPLVFVSFVRAAFRAVKKAEVVHIHDVFYMSSFFAALAARYYKKPIVLMQHVEMIAHPNKFVMIAQRLVFATTGAYIFKYAKKIITLNDRVDSFLIGCGVDPEKIIALPNGVDIDTFFPVSPAKKLEYKQMLGFDLNKKTVLFVGRFVPKKGFHKLFEAKSDEYQIVFAGGDALEQTDSRTLFLGKMSQHDLVRVYQAADIFTLPSVGEGFPLSVQEAMASGLPIITTNDIGYSRYAFDHEKIVLLDAPTSSSIQSAIKCVLENDRKMTDMSSYSREYVERHFSWNHIIDSLESLYISVKS